MAGYKLPICWRGKSITVKDENGKDTGKMVTEDMLNQDCYCSAEMQAFFCDEGHLTECHAGMTCEEAECSHFIQYIEDNDDSETQAWYGEGSSG
jgi:hypothetical protein